MNEKELNELVILLHKLALMDDFGLGELEEYNKIKEMIQIVESVIVNNK